MKNDVYEMAVRDAVAVVDTRLSGQDQLATGTGKQKTTGIPPTNAGTSVGGRRKERKRRAKALPMAGTGKITRTRQEILN